MYCMSFSKAHALMLIITGILYMRMTQQSHSSGSLRGELEGDVMLNVFVQSLSWFNSATKPELVKPWFNPMDCSLPVFPVLHCFLGVYSNSSPLSWWCHPTVSSSVIPFSSCPHSFPASGFFPMSQFFTSGGQSIRASASVLPMNIQGVDFL